MLLKMGYYLKIFGKSNFLISLELASSRLLDFSLVRVALGYFQNFNANEPVLYKRLLGNINFFSSFSLVRGKNF